MGVDLTFCPDRHESLTRGDSVPWFLAHTRIDTERDYAFQDAVRELPSCPLPADVQFDWYNDEGIERRTNDPYGSPLSFVWAGCFAAIPETILQATSAWNRGIVLFFSALRPQTAIVLWWH